MDTESLRQHDRRADAGPPRGNRRAGAHPVGRVPGDPEAPVLEAAERTVELARRAGFADAALQPVAWGYPPVVTGRRCESSQPSRWTGQPARGVLHRGEHLGSVSPINGARVSQGWLERRGGGDLKWRGRLLPTPAPLHPPAPSAHGGHRGLRTRRMPSLRCGLCAHEWPQAKPPSRPGHARRQGNVDRQGGLSRPACDTMFPDRTSSQRNRPPAAPSWRRELFGIAVGAKYAVNVPSMS